MDVSFNKQMYSNTLIYRNALERIINKYSKLCDGGIEVDFTYRDDMMPEHDMDVSRTNLNKLESENLPDVTDVSLRAQDITRDSQLDFSHQDGGSNETCISSVTTTMMSVEEYGAARIDVTQLTVSSLDESQRNLSMMDPQPEDEDEELEMILRNNGSSLMNLYPSTISRIERAQHRQHVSNAGNLVLKRYRRLRQQPNRSYVNNMFIVPRRQSNTKNVSKMVEQPSTYAVTPSQAFYPTAKASMDQSLRSERLSLAAWSPQTDIYSSPVRQSPVKARLMTSFSRSPGAFSQSPKAHAVESFSREPIRPRSMSTCDSFSPQRPTVPERMLHPQDSCHSLQTQLHSPQTAGAPAGHHGLRQHLSFVPRRQSNTKKRSSKSNSPMNIPFMGTDATSSSPLNNQQDWQSAGRVRREQHQPVLVMDPSGCSDISKPKEISLNETFNVSKIVEQPSTYAVRPSRAFYPTAKASMDQSLRSERLSLATRSLQTDRCSMSESLTTAVKERPDIYSSPVRQSPVKARLMTSLSRSPGAFSQSPKAHAMESFSKEPMRPRSMSTSDSFSPQRPTVPERMLHPQDSCHSLQTQLHSPQTAAAQAGHHGLPFDSSLSSRRDFCPSKKIDEDFVKLYHKCVCQNKSFFHGQPCCTCARSPEASRGHSSSSLATLALSPHRSLLRKRHREQGWDSHHQSKRFRDENYASSPGSRRHGNEMLRRCLSTSEYDGISYSQQQHVAQIQRPAALSRSTSGDLDESGV
ncbi:hypothetical protein E3U43_003169 [Larimichthys crocea]|uniref:Uncharacterized protein n=1 Tax=Larimichthys crocea TaxID=215358 RepID=A0ACD3RJQ1_LARCR|nr:hypothetical protein E3U43_003169 [Larimichthys crocea]